MRQEGFTVVELVVVVAVLLALLIASLLLIHPRQYTSEQRNARRWLDVALLLRATNRYVVDHGALPPGVSGTAQVIGMQDGGLDLCHHYVPGYLKDLVYDPQVGGNTSKQGCTAADALYITGYTIRQTADGRTEIAAPAAEKGEEIRLTSAQPLSGS